MKSKRKIDVKTKGVNRKKKPIKVSKKESTSAALRRLQSEFISATSHQFLTPLSTLQSSVDLLELYIKKENTTKQLLLLEKIKRSTNYLSEIVNKVTLLYKYGRAKQKVDIKKIKLRNFMIDLLDEVVMDIGSSHFVNIYIDPELSIINSDEFLLKQILSNLIHNSVKFSPNGGQIQISVNGEREFIEFSVKDEGIGIDKEDQKKLFEPFFRGKNVNVIPGIGLGLAIANNFAKILKAKLECISELNEGTLFKVRMPLNYK